MKLSLIAEADIPLTTSYDPAIKTLVKNDCTIITKALMDAGYQPIPYYGRILCYQDPQFEDVPTIKYIASALRGDDKNMPHMFVKLVTEKFAEDGREAEVKLPINLTPHAHVFGITVSKP